MNVAFFGQSGPYSSLVLRHLMARPDASYTMGTVVEGLPKRVSRRDHTWHRPKRRALPPQEDLMLTATAAGIETLQTIDVNAPYVACELARRRIDVMVCAGFPCLFGSALLACASMGALNAHPSLLPRWRGPCPIFWALRAGDKHLGVSVHHIDAWEDHGPIVAQEAFVLRPGACGRTIYGHAGALAGKLLASALSKMGRGALCAVPQNHGRATRARRPKPEDARVQPADWDCVHLVNFASGAAFFRAPWMVLGGDTYHVRTGLRASPGQRLPGEFMVHQETLMVPCRDGLALLQIQT